MREYDYYKYHYRENNMKELLCNVTVPSVVHTYSITSEYIKNWFIKHFPEGYFKHIHIDGKHAFDDFRAFSRNKTLIKRRKPMLAITPRLVFDYNRNNLDLHLKNPNLFVNNGLFDRSFYKNYEKNQFLAFEFELLQIEYSFKIKVQTRHQQVDLFKFIRMSFSIGTTETNFFDIDYHIPTYIILQIADDNGFAIKDGKVVDIIEFLAFINKKSELPITYKYRADTGNCDFFLRYRNVNYHIEMFDPITADDGDVQGQLYKDFNLEFSITTYMPTPRIFLYFSKNQNKKYFQTIEKDIKITIDGISLAISFADIPDVNSKGWNQYIITQYIDPTLDLPIEINFEAMFKDMRIKSIIDNNNKLNIPSDIFIDFIVYNANEKKEYTMNWKTYTMSLLDVNKSEKTEIAVYLDTDYVTRELTNMKELEGRYK